MSIAQRTEIERLAQDSGLTAEDVVTKLADGYLYHREHDYFGGEQPPGEWVDASGTEYVVNGSGRSTFAGYYGRGATLAEAKANFRKQGGRLTYGYTVLTFGPGSVFLGIGAMGYRYLGSSPDLYDVRGR